MRELFKYVDSAHASRILKNRPDLNWKDLFEDHVHAFVPVSKFQSLNIMTGKMEGGRTAFFCRAG